jgi:hypothetical protein
LQHPRDLFARFKDQGKTFGSSSICFHRMLFPSPRNAGRDLFAPSGGSHTQISSAIL